LSTGRKVICKDACVSKEAGGFGLIKLRSWNKAALMKHLCPTTKKKKGHIVLASFINIQKFTSNKRKIIIINKCQLETVEEREF
jgi:hypothetical protein